MLADGQCEEASRYALERGRIEIGLAIRDYCAAQAAAQIPPTAEELAAHMAKNAETGVEISPGRIVSHVSNLAGVLEVHVQQATDAPEISENDQAIAHSESCNGDWSAFYEAGGALMISFYDKHGGHVLSTLGSTELCEEHLN